MEQYGSDNLVNIRTGELDIIGMTRIIEQVKRDIAEHQQRKDAEAFFEELDKL